MTDVSVGDDSVSEHAPDNWMVQLLSTYGGRAVLRELLEEAAIFRTSFSGEQPLSMAFKEGRKDIGRIIYTWVLRVDPKAYTVMEREHQERLQIARAIAEQTGEE